MQDGLPLTMVLQLTVDEKSPAIESLTGSNAKSLYNLFRGSGDDSTHYLYQVVMDVFGKLLWGSAIGENSGINLKGYLSSVRVLTGMIRHSFQWTSRFYFRTPH